MPTWFVRKLESILPSCCRGQRLKLPCDSKEQTSAARTRKQRAAFSGSTRSQPTCQNCSKSSSLSPAFAHAVPTSTLLRLPCTSAALLNTFPSQSCPSCMGKKKSLYVALISCAALLVRGCALARNSRKWSCPAHLISQLPYSQPCNFLLLPPFTAWRGTLRFVSPVAGELGYVPLSSLTAVSVAGGPVLSFDVWGILSKPFQMSSTESVLPRLWLSIRRAPCWADCKAWFWMWNSSDLQHTRCRFARGHW